MTVNRDKAFFVCFELVFEQLAIRFDADTNQNAAHRKLERFQRLLAQNLNRDHFILADDTSQDRLGKNRHAMVWLETFNKLAPRAQSFPAMHERHSGTNFRQQ